MKKKEPTRRRKTYPGAARMIRRINDNPPTPEQLKAYVNACNALPRNETADDYFVLHVITWARMFPNEREKGNSALFRLEALAELVSKWPHVPGWSKPPRKRGGPDLTREALFEAAAIEPVIERNGRVTFNRASLLRRVFQIAAGTQA